MQRVSLGSFLGRVTRAVRAVRGFRPQVLASPGYRRLWGAGLLYYHAFWLEILAAGWVVLLLTGSPFAVGLLGFCRMLPMLLLGLVLGAAADRLRGPDLLVAVQATGLAAALTMALLFTAGRPELWQLYLVSVAIGCAWAADFSTRRALIASLTAPELASSAMSLESMSMQGSKVVATALAGALLGLGGPRLAYWWLALVYLLGLAAALRVRRHAGVVEGRATAGVSLVALARSGWSVAVGTPVIRATLLITVAMNLLVFPYQQLMVVVAEQILGVGPGRMGLLAGADGVGAIVMSGLLAFRLRTPRAGRFFVGGSLAGAALVVGLALSRWYPLSLALQVALGLCFGAFGAMQPVLILRAVGPEMRARAMGMLAMAIGVAPFGILLAGSASAAAGPSQTLTAMALVALGLMVITLLRNRSLLADPATGVADAMVARDERVAAG